MSVNVWRPVDPYPVAWTLETGDAYYTASANGYGGWAFDEIDADEFGRIEAREPDADELADAEAVAVAFETWGASEPGPHPTDCQCGDCRAGSA